MMTFGEERGLTESFYWESGSAKEWSLYGDHEINYKNKGVVHHSTKKLMSNIHKFQARCHVGILGVKFGWGFWGGMSHVSICLCPHLGAFLIVNESGES